jgi:hypothetical protein
MQKLTIQRILLITLFALLFALATRVPTDTDTWWHIRSGEYTLKHSMIYEDPFSFTKNGEEWINHSWGSQIILYLAWEVAGNIGLSLYVSILATAGMGMLYLTSEGDPYLRAFTLVLGASTAAVFWSARPQMISFFLSTIILYLLFLYKRKGIDRLWLILPVMMVWGNMHAGFSIGFIFMGGMIVGEIIGNVFMRDADELMPPQGIRKLIIVGLVSAAALVINPYTFKMLLVPFQTLSIGVLRDFIQEWNSPNFQQRQTLPFILLLFALLATVWSSKRRFDWTYFLLIAGTTFMALTAGRNIAVFAVVVTPIVTYYAAAIMEERGWIIKPIQRVTKRQARLNAALLTVILFFTLVYILSVFDSETIDKAQRNNLPIQVAEFIESEQLPGPMFNSYNWGGYLMFALPEYPVYVDGRTDLYKDEFLLRYLKTATGGDDWRKTLDEDGINMVVIEQGSGLARALGEDQDWTLIYPNDEYEDENRVIYSRNQNEEE